VGEGEKLSARWNYTILGNEQEAALELESAGKTDKIVEVAGAKPDDIVMRGVTVALNAQAG